MKDSIPEMPNIIAKQREDDYLIFNRETSSFHSVQQDAIHVLDKVDGRKTISQIAREIAQERDLNEDEVLSDLLEFFEALQKRRIVRLCQ